jgi:hypothetical protein
MHCQVSKAGFLATNSLHRKKSSRTPSRTGYTGKTPTGCQFKLFKKGNHRNLKGKKEENKLKGLPKDKYVEKGERRNPTGQNRKPRVKG